MARHVGAPERMCVELIIIIRGELRSFMSDYIQDQTINLKLTISTSKLVTPKLSQQNAISHVTYGFNRSLVPPRRASALPLSVFVISVPTDTQLTWAHAQLTCAFLPLCRGVSAVVREVTNPTRQQVQISYLRRQRLPVSTICRFLKPGGSCLLVVFSLPLLTPRTGKMIPILNEEKKIMADDTLRRKLHQTIQGF